MKMPVKIRLYIESYDPALISPEKLEELKSWLSTIPFKIEDAQSSYQSTNRGGAKFELDLGLEGNHS